MISKVNGVGDTAVFFIGSVTDIAVIQHLRLFVYFLIKRATEGDIHFLKATADP